MSQAPTYTRTTEFAGEELNNAGGRSTVRTMAVDAELDAVAVSVNHTRDNLALIQRDDGEMRDGVVHVWALGSDVSKYLTAVGGALRGTWLTATLYALRDVVTQSGNTYICSAEHTSGTFSTDLAAVKWLLLQLGGTPGAASVSFIPTVNIAATNVQAAIEEVDTDNRALTAALIASLAVSNDAAKGAGQIGFDIATAYDDDAKTVSAGLTRYVDAGYYLTNNPALNQTTALNAAIAAASGRELILPPWTIRVDGQVNLVSGLKLIGRSRLSVLDFTNTTLLSSDALMYGTGARGSAVLLTVAANKYTNSITAPSNGLAVGDWFRVISTVDANSASAGVDQLGERADVVYITETHQVVAKPSADVIEVRGMLRFSYPIGAAVRKITPLSNILLRDLTIEQGSVANRLIEATLVDCMRVNGMDVRNGGGEVLYRGCFNGSRIDHLKSHAAPDTPLATNRQAIKITDGSTGVVVADFDLANGGQMIDVTYTPGLSSTVAAPTLDTMIQRGHVRNASLSAITDHPVCDGTVVADVTMKQVRSAVFIRSRNATVKNVEAWGDRDVGGSGNGIWLGEDGYWNQATVEGCKMHGFDIGYLMAGAGADITRRDAVLANNLSTYCRVGERWGSVNTPNGSGCLSLGNRHLFPTEAGIEIGGDWVGLRVRDFLVRGGTPSVGAVNFTASCTSPEIDGQVADIGAKPAVVVSAGTPTDAMVDIRRFGSVSQNSGFTAAMCRAKPRQIARVTSFLNTP